MRLPWFEKANIWYLSDISKEDSAIILVFQKESGVLSWHIDYCAVYHDLNLSQSPHQASDLLLWITSQVTYVTMVPRVSMAPKPRGRSVSFPTRGTMVTYVTWDVPLHGNFKLRPLGATMGNVIPTPPCWGECKPNSRRRRAQVNSTIWLRELPLFGRLMLSVTLSSFGQKPELHTWSTYLLGAGITGPKVELTGLESFLYRKIPSRG